jgi:hypothetical protein
MGTNLGFLMRVIFELIPRFFVTLKLVVLLGVDGMNFPGGIWR